MIFGDAVEAAPSADVAAWLAAERSHLGGTVDWLIPRRCETIVRVVANEPGEGWWTGYRELHRSIADVARRHTSTPDRAWFAIWEGHGFTSWSSHSAWRDPPPDEATRQTREAQRERLRAETQRDIARISAGLADLPAFAAPDRRYYLLSGPVDAVDGIRDPARGGDHDHWRHPDLWWPGDRRWFVATDVDFWSLYVGGDREFIDEIRATVRTPTELVTATTPLVAED